MKSMNMTMSNEEIEKLKQERDEYLNGWKRAKADFINYQKDEAKRGKDLIEYSNEALIQQLLPVLDSFLISLSMLGEDDKARKGLDMIYAQLEKVLRAYGLEPIQSLGQKFDTSLHEALEAVESEQESGTIVEELEKGWRLHEKVIRPARVKIAKEKSDK